MDSIEDICIIPENSAGQSYSGILINCLIKALNSFLGEILDLPTIIVMTPKYHKKGRDFHPGTNACEEFNFQNKTFALQPSYLVSKEEGLLSTDKTEN